MSRIILDRSFYAQPTLTVARDLLGSFLVRKIGSKVIRARITETEAYIGEDDLACHAARGRTKRTEVMYGEPGRAYIYLIYGMYHCLNVVTEKEEFPAAVLIRVVSVEGVSQAETNGPGKLCRLLQIDRSLNGIALTREGELFIEKGEQKKEEAIQTTKRIGIEYAEHCREYLWRLVLISGDKEGR